MKYLVICIAIAMMLIPQTAFAWDDRVEDNTCSLVAGRWSSWVSGRNGSITSEDAPPQLTSYQAYRWRVSSPLSRMRLAMLYGVSNDVAIEYGAIDIDSIIQEDMYRYSVESMRQSR